MYLKPQNWRRVTTLLALLLLMSLALPAQALDKVVLQLKWAYGFQFAGYFAAIDKGYYRDAGLDVELREAQPGIDPVKNVVDGKADYGVGNSSLLLARKAGLPVVALAVIFQHSPLVLIAHDNRAIQGIHDLIGKKIMLEPRPDELLAYLKQEGIALNYITQLKHSFITEDFIDGKVDAMSAYVTNETFYIDRAGIPYHTYTPRSAGIDFYGDNLFTSEQEIKDHPARVRAMREASLRGWHYAMEHPEEIADLILAKYSKRHPREFYLFEALQMAPLLRTDLIEVGYMNPGRWRHIADTYADLGLLPRDYSLDGFLYEPNPKRNLTWLYVPLLFLALLSAVAFYIYRSNRRLIHALAESRATHEALRVSEERHRLLADNATDVIWTMNLVGQMTYVSPSVEKLRGYTSAEVMQQPLDQILTPESAQIARDGLGRIITAVSAGLPVPEFRGELEQPCKDGTTVWTEVTTTGMKNATGEFIGILGVTRDITEHRQMEEQVRQLAFHDHLTQLPNRRLLEDRLQQAIAANKRSGCYGALAFLDLDNFKPLNDLHGHKIGDLLLIEVADRLKRSVREIDTVARFGGDEFVVLVSELSTDKIESTFQAGRIAEKIRVALSATYRLPALKGDGERIIVEHHCTASIGLTLFLSNKGSQGSILNRADTAMYQAKEAGRNLVRMTSENSEETKNPDLTTFLQLVWHTDYECGNALIDLQHRTLFNDANEIMVEILADLQKDKVEALINILLNDVVQHFKDEEVILFEAGFPEAAEHAVIHRELVDHALTLANQFHSDTLEIGQLLQFLAQDVVARHMLREDRKFFPYVKKADVHLDPQLDGR